MKLVCLYIQSNKINLSGNDTTFQFRGGLRSQWASVFSIDAYCDTYCDTVFDSNTFCQKVVVVVLVCYWCPHVLKPLQKKVYPYVKR